MLENNYLKLSNGKHVAMDATLIQSARRAKKTITTHKNGEIYKANSQVLKEQKLRDGIMRKKPKGQAMSHWNKLRNKAISKRRFGQLLNTENLLNPLLEQNNKVLYRAYRNTPLTNKQKQENKQHSSIRYVIKRTFELLKLHHELAKARYLGLERNKTRVQLIAISHNLETGMNIFKQMQSLRDCYVQ